jgi:hypothetical protein
LKQVAVGKLDAFLYGGDDDLFKNPNDIDWDAASTLVANNFTYFDYSGVRK